MIGIPSTLAAYPTLLRVALAENLQYRASGVIWMIGMVLEPVIYLAVWSAVARSQGGSVAGFAPREFAAYYLAMFATNHVTFTWVMEIFQFRIQQGTLAFELLRPIHPIHADIADNLAYKAVMLVVALPAAVLLWWFFRPGLGPGAQPSPWFLIALPLAFLLRFAIEWTVALCAFWTTRIAAINRSYYALSLFLSGRAAPLALLPVWLGDAAQHLPFYAMIGLPVELALGRLDAVAARAGVLSQIGWVLATLLALSACWRAAVRRFSAVGT